MAKESLTSLHSTLHTDISAAYSSQQALRSMTSSTAPSEALMELLAPDGYYTYLGVEKPKAHHGAAAPPASSSSSSEKANPEHTPLSSGAPSVDEDAVKKNYRKLSLKHHPDKPSGDADTFRVLNRAQRVLMNPKLRQQYDILGIDLDDEEGDHNTKDDDDDGDKNKQDQGIVHEIAGMILTNIISLAVKTLMMGAVSVILVRYRWTLYPALVGLAYVIYQMFTKSHLPGGSYTDMASPALIGVGIVLMYAGRTDEGDWTMLFWLGEATVIAMFTLNSVSAIPKSPIVLIAVGILSILVALWFRGKVWNYVIVLVLETLIGVFVAVAFPIMEMVLEAILNEKLQKVGDKVRAHHSAVQAYYELKLKTRDQ